MPTESQNTAEQNVCLIMSSDTVRYVTVVFFNYR